MTKTFPIQSRKDAAKRWVAGRGTWLDGHDRDNLMIVEAVSVSYDAGNSRFNADVTMRPATDAEFVPARLRWLEKEKSRLVTVCLGDHEDTAARAALRATEAEIAELEAMEAAECAI